MKDILNPVLGIAKEAGEAILRHYSDINNCDVVTKDDGSPLTMADQDSHNIISQGLRSNYDWPIVSEEDPVDFGVRKNWPIFWLVDPLDGTKDFIAANDEFTVNIALVENGTPVFGMIYAPALDELYYAQKEKGCFFVHEGKTRNLPLYRHSDRIVAKSRFHDSDAVHEFLDSNNINRSIDCGSSLKFCKLATGEVNIYPRFVGSSEWDIAAGQIIATEAGCSIIDLVTLTTPVFNKVSIRNNNFIGLASGFNFSEFTLPRTN